MEFKIWNKTDPPAYRLIRYTAMVLLPILLTFYVLRFEAFNRYLLSLNPGHLISVTVWIDMTKFFSYCIHILLNFCILLVITNRLRYSLGMVYVAFLVLMLGAIFVVLRENFGIPFPLAFVSFFVKINKSLILLVLFIAGHFVRRIQSTP